MQPHTRDVIAEPSARAHTHTHTHAHTHTHTHTGCIPTHVASGSVCALQCSWRRHASLLPVCELEGHDDCARFLR
jgi:hypothetical protein